MTVCKNCRVEVRLGDMGPAFGKTWVHAGPVLGPPHDPIPVDSALLPEEKVSSAQRLFDLEQGVRELILGFTNERAQMWKEIERLREVVSRHERVLEGAAQAAARVGGGSHQ